MPFSERLDGIARVALDLNYNFRASALLEARAQA